MVSSLYHFHEWIWDYEKGKLEAKYGVRSKVKLWHNVVEKQVLDAGQIRNLTNVQSTLRSRTRNGPHRPRRCAIAPTPPSLSLNPAQVVAAT